MKRLRPQDIIKTNRYVGYKPRQIRAMIEHYGFERANDDGKHIRFTHRDYNDLTFNMQYGGADVMQLYVLDAVNGCMEVKRRNAERKEPVFQRTPSWVWKALSGGSLFERSDNRIHFEADAIIDTGSTNKPPVRHYMVEMRGDKLTIRNLDYPMGEFGATFTVRNGSANIQGLRMMFNELDAQVKQHTEEMAAHFEDRLMRLKEHHGFTSTIKEHRGGDRLVLSHPIYTGGLDIPAPMAGHVIPDESVERIDALLEHSREQYLSQLILLEELQSRGWQVEQRPANGSAAALRLLGPGGERVEVPTYGMHGIFDEQRLRREIEEQTAKALAGELSYLPEMEKAHEGESITAVIATEVGEVPLTEARRVDVPVQNMPVNGPEEAPTVEATEIIAEKPTAKLGSAPLWRLVRIPMPTELPRDPIDLAYKLEVTEAVSGKDAALRLLIPDLPAPISSGSKKGTILDAEPSPAAKITQAALKGLAKTPPTPELK